MDHITHDEFAGRLEKIMEPLISRPSFKAKIAFFHGNVSSYNPYGTDRLHGAKAYIRALSKVLANPDKIDALNNKTPSMIWYVHSCISKAYTMRLIMAVRTWHLKIPPRILSFFYMPLMTFGPMSAPVYRVCEEGIPSIIIQRSFSHCRIFVQFLFMVNLKIESFYNHRRPEIDVVGCDCSIFPVFQ